MSDPSALAVLADVVTRLEKVGIEYAIGGSTASGVWGQPRYTNDVDINVALPGERSAEFLQAFASAYVISESELLDALANRATYRMLQALHVEQAFKIDFFLVDDEPFGRSVLERARSVTLAPGVVCLVQAPEDVVLNKLRWYELGHRVSERQWNDVVQVIEVQAEHLDLGYLKEWAGQLGVVELLTQALKEVGLG